MSDTSLESAAEHGHTLAVEWPLTADEFDRLLGLSPAQPTDDRAETIIRLMAVLLDGRLAPKSIGIRVLAVACMIRHPRVHNMTTPQVAREARITKAAIALCASKLRHKLGFHSAWMRSEAGREAMRIAAKRAHARRRAGRKEVTP